MNARQLLRYKGYSAIPEYSLTERTFRGVVLGIRDQVEFQSDDAKALEEEFHRAVDQYLEHCAAAGKKPQRDYNGLFNVRISPELHKEISMYAQAEGISLNKSIELAIQKFLQK